ncbi:hypothetical protein D3C72_1343220 [compost metagenome]
MVLDRRARERHAPVRVHAPGGLGLLGAGVLDVLGLVVDRARPAHAGQIGLVAEHERVGRDDQVVALDGLGEALAFRAARAVVDHDLQVRGEVPGLALPVADERGGANQEPRPALGGGKLLGVRLGLEQQGQHLDGLAQAHVVGEAGAEAELAHGRQPGVASFLVRAQGALEVLGRDGALHPIAGAEVRQELAEAPLGRHRHDGQPGGLAGGVLGQLHGVHHGHLAVALAVEEAKRALDLVGVELDPLAAQLEQRHLHGHQPLEVLARERLVAQRQAPVVVDQGLVTDLAGGAVVLLAHGDFDAQARPVGAPPRRHEHGEAGLFEVRHGLAQEGVGLGGGQIDGVGVRALEPALNRRVDLARAGQVLE